MDKKKLVLLVGALIVALGTAFLAKSMFSGAATPQAEAKIEAPRGPSVLVATRALPVGTIVTLDALSYQPWPEGLVEDAYFIEGESGGEAGENSPQGIEAFLGTVVREPITAGQPVTRGSLVTPGDRGFLAAALSPGMRAVTFPVSARTGVAGFVFPGDRIDLVLTQALSDAGTETNVSETIMRNLRVLATDQRAAPSKTRDGKTVVRRFRMVTVEVTPRLAEKIAVAQTLGTLSLSLRSIADNQAELDRAIAAGEINLPEGADREAEERALRAVLAHPSDAGKTFVTGGDVSRFARRTVPEPQRTIAVRMPDGATVVTAAPQRPTVRISRGNNVSEVPLGVIKMTMARTRRLHHAATALAGSFAMIATPIATTGAQAQTVSSATGLITLSIGRGELVTLPGSIADVFIANDQIADIQVKSARQIYVFGKAGGETTLYASNERGDIIFSTTIRVGSNIDTIDQMLGLAMPDAQIAVNTMNGMVLLTGTVAKPEDVAEAERLVTAFVNAQPSPIQTTVVSRLRTATPLQVNLQVRFAEVSRSLVRELSSNVTTADGSGGFLFGLGRGRNAITLDGADSTFNNLANSTTIAGIAQLFGIDVGLAFDAAERNGLITTLSQPNLTALSGETATFRAGGEYPIPVSSGLGQTSVEFREYGVSLTYTPTVLSNGRISLRVTPEISELSSQGAVVLDNISIPALTTRRAETSVELGSGQSFMIAGLLSNSSQTALGKTPGIGDVPVLGQLFRSTSFQRNETELVIIVTPYLVRPVNANDIALPTDGYIAPGPAEQYLTMQEGRSVSGQGRPLPSVAQGDATPSIGAAPVAPAPAVPFATPQAANRNPVAGDAQPGFSFE